MKNKTKRLGKIRGNKFVALIAVLLIAGVGSYLVTASRAFDYNSYKSPGMLDWRDDGVAYTLAHGNYVAPLGSTINGHIDIATDDFTRYDPSSSVPHSSVYLLFYYNPEMIRFTGSTCVWKLGCTIKTGDDLYYSAKTDDPGSKFDSPDNRWLYKAQVLLCFNIPANPLRTPHARAATYQFKRTNQPMPHYDNPNPNGPPIKDEIQYHRHANFGQRQDSCESNPDFKDIWFHGRATNCGRDVDSLRPIKCNGLSDPGIGGAALTGFGNGGNGNGGEGSGNNGVGSGPGAGSGGGGGGSSANRQADKPNSLPSPSPQGEDKQTELEPNPFFDGKDFEKGSDSDNLVFGNSTIGGKKVPKILLYILSALLLGGAGGALYWRWKRR